MLLDADSPQEWQESETINHNLVRRAIAADGTCTGEHGVGLHKMQFMAEEHGEEALTLMRSLKHAFDPNNILNPGKIIAWWRRRRGARCRLKPTRTSRGLFHARRARLCG